MRDGVLPEVTQKPIVICWEQRPVRVLWDQPTALVRWEQPAFRAHITTGWSQQVAGDDYELWLDDDQLTLDADDLVIGTIVAPTVAVFFGISIGDETDVITLDGADLQIDQAA